LKFDLFEAEILRVTTLLGNASVLDQSGLELASPLASGGIYSNGGANVNRWASPLQSEVWILTINITLFDLIFYCSQKHY
jgi:protein quaking